MPLDRIDRGDEDEIVDDAVVFNVFSLNIVNTWAI
jgi:hypothetical protein